MTTILPSFREAGAGPGVVCLHANASSSSQWRGLIEMLAPDYRVLAADAYGVGKGPAWPVDRVVRLGDEVALLEPLFARAGRPLSLVGHSYGAAVALIAALRQPRSVKALALYEPTLFSVVDAESPSPNDVDGIRNAVALAATALEADDLNSAAQHFIDFWMGTGAWAQTPENRRGPIAASIRNVGGWADALFKEPTPLDAFATLNVPAVHDRRALPALLSKRGPTPDPGSPAGRGHGVRGAGTHGPSHASAARERSNLPISLAELTNRRAIRYRPQAPAGFQSEGMPLG